MNGRILVALGLSLSVPAAAQNGDQPSAIAALSAATRTWFQHLKEGLAGSAVAGNYQRRRGIQAVAAVRGAKQSLEDPDKPYWKGAASAKRETRVAKEREELGAATDLALAGKADDAAKAFEAFAQAHPTSALAAAARQARDKLGAPSAYKP